MHTLPTIEITTRKGRKLSPEFFARLCAFYKQNEPAHLSFIWKHIYVFYEPLINALESESIDKVEDILETMYAAGNIIIGLDSNPTSDQWNDYCIRAACALRVIPVYNPEQPNSIELKHESLIDSMENALGFRIDHPGGGDLHGAMVGNRFIPLKLLEAVATLKTCLRLNPCPSSILELGAGMGWLAYAFRCNVRVTYEIQDLPIVGVIQGYCLALGLGEECLTFMGERKAVPILIRGQHCPEPAEPHADIIINQNSLPEMEAHMQEHYLRYIEQSLDDDGMFVSINQEADNGGQLRVFEAVKRHTKLRLKSASPWWMRSGYVEEIFVKNGS